MRGAIILLLGVASVGCGAPERPVSLPAEPAPSASVASPAPPSRATGCSATPSTIYGDEVVTFALEGEGTAEVEVVDQRQRPVFSGNTPLPGPLRVPQLPSGDFTLRIAPSGPSCQVTVNRELPRASSAGR